MSGSHNNEPQMLFPKLRKRGAMLMGALAFGGAAAEAGMDVQSASANSETAVSHETQSPQAYIAGVNKIMVSLLKASQAIPGVPHEKIAGGGTEYQLYAPNPSDHSLHDKLVIDTGPDGTMKNGGISITTADDLNSNGSGYAKPKLHFVYSLGPAIELTNPPKAIPDSLELMVIGNPTSNPAATETSAYTVTTVAKVPKSPLVKRSTDYKVNSFLVTQKINYVTSYAKEIAKNRIASYKDS